MPRAGCRVDGHRGRRATPLPRPRALDLPAAALPGSRVPGADRSCSPKAPWSPAPGFPRLRGPVPLPGFSRLRGPRARTLPLPVPEAPRAPSEPTAPPLRRSAAPSGRPLRRSPSRHPSTLGPRRPSSPPRSPDSRAPGASRSPALPGRRFPPPGRSWWRARPWWRAPRARRGGCRGRTGGCRGPPGAGGVAGRGRGGGRTGAVPVPGAAASRSRGCRCVRNGVLCCLTGRHRPWRGLSDVPEEVRVTACGRALPCVFVRC